LLFGKTTRKNKLKRYPFSHTNLQFFTHY